MDLREPGSRWGAGFARSSQWTRRGREGREVPHGVYWEIHENIYMELKGGRRSRWPQRLAALPLKKNYYPSIRNHVITICKTLVPFNVIHHKPILTRFLSIVFSYSQNYPYPSKILTSATPSYGESATSCVSIGWGVPKLLQSPQVLHHLPPPPRPKKFFFNFLRPFYVLVLLIDHSKKYVQIWTFWPR